MPSKKDLSAFKKPTLKSVLAETPAPVDPQPSLPKAQAKPAKGRVGRKPKNPEDKESEMVGLMLTRSEKAMLLEKAGLIKLGTFIKHKLRTETDIFKP